jgi:hypothetical protein
MNRRLAIALATSRMPASTNRVVVRNVFLPRMTSPTATALLPRSGCAGREGGLRTGGEVATRQFQRFVGGDIRRIVPANGALGLGPYRGHNPGWYHHEVVVRRVYDAFTEYK